MGGAENWFVQGDGAPEEIHLQAPIHGVGPQDTAIITGTMQRTWECTQAVFPQNGKTDDDLSLSGICIE